MLKEAIEKIVSLAQPMIYDDGSGHSYSNKEFKEIRPQEYYASRLDVNSLDAIVKMVQEEAAHEYGGKLYVRITDHDTVDVFTSLDARMVRTNIYRARSDVPGFREGWREKEQMLIALRSLFLPSEDVNYLLDMLSRMDSNESVSTIDNGVTQTVESKKGVALKEKVVVRPRVKLTPFRTFLEVAQPESEYLLRVREGGDIALFEADGGVWKLVAKKSIHEYLTERLKDLVDEGKVVIME